MKTKNLEIKNYWHSIFCAIFLICAFFSNVYGENKSLETRRKVQAAPTVANPIPDQNAHNGQAFSLSINPYDVFNDADGDPLTFTFKQADDSNLPSWLTVEDKSHLFHFAGSYNTPDDACGVTVVGNYAYVADGTSGLQIIDVSNPATPTLAGTYNTPDYAYDVAVAGSYAYVADSSSGLQIIDVSNPATPILAGSYNTPGYAYDVAVAGSYAYVADYSWGLQIIDVSNPATPILTGSYNTPTYAYDVTVSGNYAYVANDSSGLQIIDISNPATPTLAGSYDTPGDALGVVVNGNYAYVADGFSGGLQIIDISNPTIPTLAGSYDTPGYARGVAVAGNYAYVADGNSGIIALEISDPTNPTLVESYDTPGSALGVAVASNYFYVADDFEGLKIIERVSQGIQLSGIPANSDIGILNLKVTANDGFSEVSDTFSIDVSNVAPTVIGTVPNQVTNNNYIFKMSINPYDVFNDADGDDLILTFKKADDSSLPAWLTVGDGSYVLSLVGARDTSGNALNVAVFGNYAYVADYDFGLQIIDVSNPTTPTLTGSYDTPSYALSVAIDGNYAYVADYSSGLQIIDVSNPATPTLTGSYNTPGYARGVALAGNYAYVADGTSGLQIIDVSNPATPTLAGTYNTPDYAYDVAVAGSYAYVADSSSGLQIIDVSNPSSPFLVGSYNTPGSARGITVVGNYVYVADRGSGLQIIDVSNPATPTLTGSYDTPNYAYGVAVAGNYAYVADDSSGIIVLDISDPTNPTLLTSYDTFAANDVYIADNYAYVPDSYSGLKIIKLNLGTQLNGIPDISDVGILNLKVTASDGVEEISTTFSIDVQNDAPTVATTIPNQVASHDEFFNFNILTYTTFNDPNNNNLSLTVKQADDSALPAWLTYETNDLNFNLVGTHDTPGFAFNVAVAGNYAYVADYDFGLQIIDVSNPANPISVGNIIPSVAFDVAVVGNYAYVASGFGLVIINVSDPSNPNEVGVCPLPGSSDEIAVAGNYAYMVNRSGPDGSLNVINVSNPFNPTLIGTCTVPGDARGVAHVGDYAYVADGTSGLTVIDISNPSAPAIVGTCDTLDNALGIAVAGNYAYVGDSSSGLTVIDISTPSSPSLIGACNTPDSALRITVVGNYAYVAGVSAGLQVIDVTNPAAPSLLGTYNTPGSALGVAVDGNYVYMANFDAGLQIFEKTTDPGMQLKGTPRMSDLGTLNLKVTASDSLAEVSTTFSIDVQNTAPTVIGTISNQVIQNGQNLDLDILTYSIFNDFNGDNLSLTIKQADDSALPAWLVPGPRQVDPNLLGTYDTANYARGVAVVANHAYVADYTGGLKIIDVDSPATPILLGTYGALGEAVGVAVAGDYAYVAGGTAGLHVIDVSTLAAPTLAGIYDTSGSARGVVVVRGYAYVADDDAGLQIIDISDPTNPTLAGSLNTTGSASGVDVIDNYAFIADGNFGLQVIDISDPTNPTWVGTYNTPGVASGVAVIGNYAYVVDGTAGLQIIDISTPSAPVLVGTYNTPGTASGISAVGDYVYIADKDSGLQVIDVSDPANPILIGTYDTLGSAYGVAVSGDYVYVADNDAGLQILEKIEQGLRLSGTPSITDVETLNIKVTASDSVAEVSTTFSISVQNTAPEISAVPKSTTEDITLLFSAVDFTSHFSDVNGNSLAKIQVVNLPANGVLKLSGVDVIVNQEIDVGDLGNFTFEPDTDWNGTTFFAWKGSDGTDYSASSANVDIQVNAAQDVPVVSDVSKVGTEDVPLTFSESDFTSKFSDVDGDSLTKIQVVSLPANGVLKLSGVDVTLNQEIDVIDLINFTFEPDTDWNGNTLFAWKGSDGIEYSINSANVNIQIDPADDSPVVTDFAKVGTEDTILTFSASDFTDHFSDIDGNGLTKIQVVSLPDNGVLKASYGAVTLGEEIYYNWLDNLNFEPDADWNGNTFFAWKGSDDIGYSSTSANVNIQIDPVQDAPTIDSFSEKIGQEDTILTFSASDFINNFNDVDGDSLTKIQITQLPYHGVLKLSGSTVILDQEIDVVDLDNLTFEPDEKDWYGRDSFYWDGHDGIEYSSTSSRGFWVQIDPVNDAPVINLSSDALIYDSCDSEVVIDSTITIEDVDNEYLDGAKVVLGGEADLTVDSLSFVDQSGITGSYDADTGELTLSGDATVANYQNALRDIMYTHKGGSVPLDSITVSFSANDGLIDGVVGIKNIDIDDRISGCGPKSSSFAKWGPGLIGGLAAAGSAVLTCTVTGLTIATVYFVKKNRAKVEMDVALDDVVIEKK